MAEQAGLSIGAIGEQQAALSRQHAAAATPTAPSRKHSPARMRQRVEGIRRLDAIAAEIDSAVTNQAAIGLDTAMGAREFQKFLIAKQREILAVVSDAHELDAAKKAVLEKLTAALHRLRRLALKAPRAGRRCAHE